MPNFFISYTQTDRAWAEWIAWQLEEAGYTTFLQAWDFRPSQNFVLRMNEGIRSSERIIAVLSPDYLNSSFASPEWASAFAQDPKGEKGILLPIRIRECDLKGLFNPIIYIDLVDKNEAEAKDALLSGVESGKRGKPPTEPEFPPSSQRLISEHPSFPGPRAKRRNIKSLTVLGLFLAVAIVATYGFWYRNRRLQEAPRPCSKSSAETRYYEAEDAELLGGASQDSEHFGFSGDGFVSGYGAEPEAGTTFWVEVPSDGEYQIDLCYANATNSPKTLSIYLDEQRIKQTRLPNASRWNIWLIKTDVLPLKAGSNAISYRKTPGDTGQVNLDFIGILQKPNVYASPQPTTKPTPASSVGTVATPDVSPTSVATLTPPKREETKPGWETLAKSARDAFPESTNIRNVMKAGEPECNDGVCKQTVTVVVLDSADLPKNHSVIVTYHQSTGQIISAKRLNR